MIRLTMSPVAEPQNKQKLAAVVARNIQSEIVNRGWPVGETVGSEAELLERHGVSRAVLREAVRLLEQAQVARMRRGPGGGLIIHAPAASGVAEAIATHFAFARITVEEVYEARRALEGLAARRAAERLDDASRSRLRALADQAREGRLEDFQLHLAVAEMTGNEALRIFVASLTRATGRLAGRARSRATLKKTDLADLRRAHLAILEAIEEGDPGLAQHRMHSHLTATEAWLEQRRRYGARARADEGEEDTTDKLAARTARLIAEQISADGLAPGAVLGSEAELLEREGVSRAVLREAVRLLEHHGVARMRRGPGGGLVVGEPQPDNVVDQVVVYLDYIGLRQTDLYDAREAIELSAVRLAAERVDELHRAGIEEALAVEAQAPFDQLGRVGEHVHRALADASDNRALSFFTQVLGRMTAEHAPEGRTVPAAQRAKIAEEVGMVHRRIADAVLSGDAGLARHRMKRHLEALMPWLRDERRSWE